MSVDDQSPLKSSPADVSPTQSLAGQVGPISPHSSSETAEEVSGPADSFLSFRVGSVFLAIATDEVDEICAQSEVTPMPLAPPHIPGLISHYGHVLPLLDLSLFLDLPQEEGPGASGAEILADASFSRIAVVSAEGMRVGILCDHIRGVVEVLRRKQRKPEIVQGQKLREFAQAEVEVKGGVMLILDLVRVLRAAKIAG